MFLTALHILFIKIVPLVLRRFQVVTATQLTELCILLEVFVYKAFWNAHRLRELQCLLFIPCTTLKALHGVLIEQKMWACLHGKKWLAGFKRECMNSVLFQHWCKVKATYSTIYNILYCNKMYMYLT